MTSRSRRDLASLGRAESRAFHEDGSSVAVAGVAPRRRSSPALCTAATPLFPRPPSRLQSPVGAAFRGRPAGRFAPAPVRPAGAPAEVTFALPGPGATSLRSDAPVRGLFHGWLRDRKNPRTLRSSAKKWTMNAVRPTAACHLLRRRQAAAGDHFLFGRRDSPSALLRTRHGSLFAPSPSKPLARIPGRRTVPPCG